MRIRIDLKILLFIGLFYFTNQLKIYLIIMFFTLFHELGHMLIALLLKKRVYKIEVTPFGFCISFTTNIEQSPIEELLISIAGPITSFLLAILFYNIDVTYFSKQEVVYSNILIGLFNLIPIFQLDGARIIKSLIQTKYGLIKAQIISEKISDITIVLITVICSILVFYYRNLAFFLICIFLWICVLKEKMSKHLLFNK